MDTKHQAGQVAKRRKCAPRYLCRSTFRLNNTEFHYRVAAIFRLLVVTFTIYTGTVATGIDLAGAQVAWNSHPTGNNICF